MHDHVRPNLTPQAVAPRRRSAGRAL